MTLPAIPIRPILGAHTLKSQRLFVDTVADAVLRAITQAMRYPSLARRKRVPMPPLTNEADDNIAL